MEEYSFDKIQDKISKLSARDPTTKAFTLVLDLDETLIHYDEQNSHLWVRPYLDHFVHELKEYFNIVIFTASIQEYADIIINFLDQEKIHFKEKFYRKHLTTLPNGQLSKNLNVIHPDLSKILIVDNTPENFQEQQENGIWIKSWYGDQNDKSLKKLIELLKNMVISG